MGAKTQNGFTIIEVLLFLSVTGLLAIGILAGSGLAISQQRYRDSVNSLKSYIQQQYSEVANVINSRTQTWNCDNTATINEVPAGGQARGTSDCVVLGRYLTISDTGTLLTASNVVGYRISGAAEATTDIAEIANNYRLAISPVDQDEEEVAWGAQVVKQKTTAAQPMSILILRSPLSGSLITFSMEGVQTNLNTLVSLANTNQVRDLCVNADIGTFVGKRLEVRMDAYATSQSAISIPPESESVCD